MVERYHKPAITVWDDEALQSIEAKMSYGGRGDDNKRPHHSHAVVHNSKLYSNLAGTSIYKTGSLYCALYGGMPSPSDTSISSYWLAVTGGASTSNPSKTSLIPALHKAYFFLELSDNSKKAKFSSLDENWLNGSVPTDSQNSGPLGVSSTVQGILEELCSGIIGECAPLPLDSFQLQIS